MSRAFECSPSCDAVTPDQHERVPARNFAQTIYTNQLARASGANKRTHTHKYMHFAPRFPQNPHSKLNSTSLCDGDATPNTRALCAVCSGTPSPPHVRKLSHPSINTCASPPSSPPYFAARDGVRCTLHTPFPRTILVI